MFVHMLPYFSHIEPAPPLMSEESRDYLNQAPPNLYQDNSFTGNDTTSTAGLLIAVEPSTSVCIAAPIEREGSKADSSRNETVTPPFENGLNNDSFVQESISHAANSNEHEIIFPNENQGNEEAETAFDKEPTGCESPEIENNADSIADNPSSSPKEEENEPPNNNDEKKQLTIDSNRPLFEHVEHEDKQIPATTSEGLEDVLSLGEESKNIDKNIETVQEIDDSYNSVGLSLSSLKSHENSTLTPIG